MINQYSECVSFSGSGSDEKVREVYLMLNKSPFTNKIINTKRGPVWTNGEIYVLNDPAFKEFPFKEISESLDDHTILFVQPHIGAEGMLLYTVKQKDDKDLLENFVEKIISSKKESIAEQRGLLDQNTYDRDNIFRILKTYIDHLDKEQSIGNDNKGEFFAAKEEYLRYAENITNSTKANLGIKRSCQTNYLMIENNTQNGHIIIAIPYLPLAKDFKSLEELF